MKKIIALLLVFVMTLGLCACSGFGNGDGKDAEGLQIGYAKINTTPKFQVGLAGYSDAETRKNTDGLTSYIYATCIAAKEGDETILLFTVDLIGINTSRADELSAAVAEAVGIPAEKMFFGATHCHNAPEDSGEYKSLLTEKVVEAAKGALADLAPATMSAASTQAEGMTFVRHYKMSDGSYAGANFGDKTKGYAGHAADPDEEMIVVKFDRPEEKKDVLLVNFQSHTDRAKQIGYNMISASWAGVLRDELEAKSGCLTAYFTGASGNLNPDSEISEEKHNLDWKAYGQKLGQIAYDTMSKLQPVGGSGIASTTYTMDAEVDHSWDHMAAQAREVYDLWKNTGKEAGDALGKTYGFSSSYQARAILSRSRMAATSSMEQGAFRIHNMGFIVGDYEMFCENGMAVKKSGIESGYDAVFVITGNKGYIPSEAAFNYRCYEADTGYFAKGTAEKLQNKFVDLLNSIK